MDKNSIYKAILIFGGGLLLFALLKPKDTPGAKGTGTASFDGEKADATPEQKANVRVVMDAYQMAIKAGETPMNLSELNKEFMKEYGMRCYQKKDGSMVVTNEKGQVISTN